MTGSKALIIRYEIRLTAMPDHACNSSTAFDEHRRECGGAGNSADQRKKRGAAS